MNRSGSLDNLSPNLRLLAVTQKVFEAGDHACPTDPCEQCGLAILLADVTARQSRLANVEPATVDRRTCRCGQFPLAEYGPRCPSCDEEDGA
jgi:uncharacterized cysteine cluster protein YcgN (CxxCxxCC family)